MKNIQKSTKIKSKAKVKVKDKTRQKAEVPFFHSIAMRLIVSFLIPVAGVLILGIISYI